MTRDALAQAEKRARSRAGHRIAFFGHAIAYGSTVLLLAFLSFPAAIIVALAWGIGLSLHWFFAVQAPELRDRWIQDELERAVPAARAAQRVESEGQHARRTERLAASLAHEIRNPIAAAKSLVRQIGDDPTAATLNSVFLDRILGVSGSTSHRNDGGAPPLDLASGAQRRNDGPTGTYPGLIMSAA